MTVLMTLEAIIFLPSLPVVSSWVKCKGCRIGQVYFKGTPTGLCVQLVGNTWKVLLERVGLRRLSEAIALYMWYDESQTCFPRTVKALGGIPVPAGDDFTA